MAVSGAQAQITSAVLGWEAPALRRTVLVALNIAWAERELGHIHGDHLLDIPFPVKVRDEIVQAGQAQPHHILAGSGWISFYLKETADIHRAIQLLRRSYDLAALQRQKRQGNAS